MYTKPLILATLLALKAAATSKTFTANYDDLTRPAAVIKLLTTYDSLTYTSWGLSPTVPGGVKVGGIAPHSGANDIKAGLDVDVLSGGKTPSFAPAPPYKTFGLLDFWFGCGVDDGQSSVNVAAKCTIVVTGFAAGTGKQVGVKDFVFTPPLSPVSSVGMVHAVLPAGFWKGLGRVTVVAENATDSVLVDDLHYVVST